MACKNRNILLLLDQCMAHCHEDFKLKHVLVLYLLPNIQSYMQSLNQFIVYCMKHKGEVVPVLN
jgi:hypothetical protein